jgi:exonuclease III
MISGFRELRVCTWNVQGLGDEKKCPVVRTALSGASPSIICLQETKTRDMSIAKTRSFLPSNLSAFSCVDSTGSSGGILTAWDPDVFSLDHTHRSPYSLTVHLASTTTDLAFTLTNVYAPADHSFTSAFLADFVSLAPAPPLPWMIVGDFNLLRAPSDKNNSNFNASLASSFNDAIRTLALFELPLLDRRYTWTNRRDSPVLARLDRALFNHAWNLRLPQSALSSLPRPTSDHFPLLVTATTDIPRSQCFRFENAWLLDPLFLPTTLPLWFRPAMVADAAIDINARLKSFRFAAKVWKRKHHYTPLLENDYSFVLDLLDFYEELRPLSRGELSLRDECRTRL